MQGVSKTLLTRLASYSYGRLAQYDQAYPHSVKRPSIDFAQSLGRILLNPKDELVECVIMVQLPFTRKINPVGM